MADDEDYPSLSDVGDCYLTDQEDAIEENVLQDLEDGREEECHWSLSLLRPEHVFNIEEGKQALRNINSLSLFSNIEVTPRPYEKSEGGIIVEIKLKELEQKSAEVSTEWSIAPGSFGRPTLELENPLILIHDKKISDINSLLPVLEIALKTKRSLLIVSEDVVDDALAMLLLNKHRAGLKVCAIKAPGFGENRRANLEDLAILTGGEVITEDRGLNLSKIKLEKLGTAKKVTVSLDDTIILHGGGDKKLIEERCAALRTGIEESTTLFDKEKAQERLSKHLEYNTPFS